MNRPSMTDEQDRFLDKWTFDSVDWRRWVDIEFVLCSTWLCNGTPVDAFTEKYRWVFRCEKCKTDLERFILGEKLDEEALRSLEYFLTVAVPKIRKRLEERERKEEARWNR